ncbi:MAG: hypothetical protein AAGF12_19150 [Myxococcota bacterium]
MPEPTRVGPCPRTSRARVLQAARFKAVQFARWPIAVAIALIGCGGGSPPRSTSTELSTEPAEGPVETPAVYRMQLAEDGQALRMTLWLRVESNEVRADLPDEPGRSVRRAALQDVRCDDASLSAGPDGFILPAGCSALRWSVPFSALPPDGLHPETRASVYDPERGLYLVSGAATFLVPESLTERPNVDFRLPASLPVHHQLPDAGGLGHTLPPRSQLGRLSIGLGSFTVREQNIGRTRIRHLMDNEATIDLEGLALGFQYLTAKSGAPPPRSLDVFWFARPAAGPDGAPPRRLGGAAGLDSIVANYFRDLPDDAPVTFRRAALAVLFHQYFASLSGRQVPPWMSQSLGQFYALKAWEHSGAIPEEDLSQIVESAAVASPERTVIDAFESWAETGRDEDYRSFYRLGLGFWVALDAHIADASDGERALDTVLEDLLGLVYGRDGMPPRRFLQILDESGASGAGAITRPFLGWPAGPDE